MDASLTYLQHFLVFTVLVLALLGNEPQRAAHAQSGTTKGPTKLTGTSLGVTTLPPPGGGRTTIIAKRTTVPGLATTAQRVGGATGRVTQLGTERIVGASARNTGVPTHKSITSGVTHMPGTGTLPVSGAITTLSPAATVKPGETPGPVGTPGPRLTTEKSVSVHAGVSVHGETQRSQPAASISVAQWTTVSPYSRASTRVPTVSTTPWPFVPDVQWDITYSLMTTPYALTKSNRAACVMNQRNTIASRFNIPITRVVGTRCYQSDTIKPTEIIVTASITQGAKPTVDELKTFKDLSTEQDFYTKGPSNNLLLTRGSFQYTERAPKKTSSDFLWKGLSETHLIMIGMGAVILLLFTISITVICMGRRSGGGSGLGSQRLDEETSVDAASETETQLESEVKPKKKLFGFLKCKNEADDVESDVSGRTDDESAYESNKDEEEAYNQLPSDQGSDRIPDEHKSY